ncbi:hypothetical protein APY04_3450 [Hyphomicrobium sulfonivorans]|uniref:Uncharacterized protein n=1 Tax=Hyphomicrobium sulfonivorans TaxID=121290 RepID=A0A109B8I8_HYPSL|nr:hypothetical protein APY04_3450 [Hyphomicrobium sulfonivorans]
MTSDFAQVVACSPSPSSPRFQGASSGFRVNFLALHLMLKRTG